MSVFWDKAGTTWRRSAAERAGALGGRPSSVQPLHPAATRPAPSRRPSLSDSGAHGWSTSTPILRGKDLETGARSAPTERDEQFAALQGAQAAVLDLLNWQEWWKVAQQAGFLDASMISSETNLVYSYAMFLIGRRDFGADWYELRRLMARWLFMNALTARYSGSSETVMEADLNRLRDLKSLDEFASLVNQQVDDTLGEDYWNITLPNDLATAGARSPYLFAYQAALNLLGARALFSQDSVAALLAPACMA